MRCVTRQAVERMHCIGWTADPAKRNKHQIPCPVRDTSLQYSVNSRPRLQRRAASNQGKAALFSWAFQPWVLPSRHQLYSNGVSNPSHHCHHHSAHYTPAISSARPSFFPLSAENLFWQGGGMQSTIWAKMHYILGLQRRESGRQQVPQPPLPIHPSPDTRKCS